MALCIGFGKKYPVNLVRLYCVFSFVTLWRELFQGRWACGQNTQQTPANPFLTCSLSLFCELAVLAAHQVHFWLPPMETPTAPVSAQSSTLYFPVSLTSILQDLEQEIRDRLSEFPPGNKKRKTANQDHTWRRDSKWRGWSGYLTTEIRTLEERNCNFIPHDHPVQNLQQISDDDLKLNVGGTIFYSKRSTLLKEEGSMLAAMFSGRFPLVRDADGAYFIDRWNSEIKCEKIDCRFSEIRPIFDIFWITCEMVTRWLCQRVQRC